MANTKAFRFLMNAFWLQDLAISLVTKLHPSVEHGLSKTAALKKAFYFVEADKLEGDYLEFGVFQGASLIGAYKSWRGLSPGQEIPRAFYGFDSFEGVKIQDRSDEHPLWVEGSFQVDFARVKKRIARHLGKANWTLVKGYLEDVAKDKAITSYGITKVAIALIDVDLGAPSKIALDFLKPALQEGSVIIFDDYLYYKGNPNLGEQGAFSAFQRENPGFKFSRLFDYGVSGRAFILSEMR